MPRFLHPPMPDVPRVLRGLFFPWFRASRDLVPHVLLFDRCSRVPLTSCASDDLCLNALFHLISCSRAPMFTAYCIFGAVAIDFFSSLEYG